MISKEEFIDCLKFIETQDKKQSKLCEVLEDLSPDCYCDAFIYSEYEQRLVKMLVRNIADSLSSDIDLIYVDVAYFMYDLEFGKYSKEDDVIIDNKKYCLNSSEALYDYLLEVYGGN